MTRAIIYARVSSAEQAASGLGIEAQTHRCRAYCESQGWTVADTLTDNGMSGGKAPNKRPAMRRALQVLDAGEADVLVVAKLDRLGRDLFDILALTKRARRKPHQWALAVLDCGVDTSTAAGDLFFNMLAAFAQFERKVGAERSAAARARAKTRGVRFGGPVRISQEAVDRVLALRAEGLSKNATAKQLNAEAVPTARGGKWYASTVAQVERTLALDAEAEERRRKYEARNS